MKIPLHVKIRKQLRALLYKLLALFKPQQQKQHSLNKDEIHSIVIIRPNYRIGNLILLTPLINELHKELPHAKIDLIVGMKLAGDILQEMPNVENVYAISRDLLKKPWELFGFIQKIRSKRYDLALNITAGSVSSELATLLVNAKYKASFEHKKTFIPLTHTVKVENLYTHAGSKAIELLKLFTQELPTHNVPLDIKLTQEELNEGKSILQTLLKGKKQPSYTIALFRNARFDKKIADSWWREWYDELLEFDENIVVIDILSPDIPTKLHENMLEYGNKNLRLLGAVFKACDLYVSADTGPLHLATASRANAFALFNATHIQKFGTLGENNITIDINSLSPQEVAQQIYLYLKKEI